MLVVEAALGVGKKLSVGIEGAEGAMLVEKAGLAALEASWER
jgi:hypothetical protein